jgi:hypothetical protein
MFFPFLLSVLATMVAASAQTQTQVTVNCSLSSLLPGQATVCHAMVGGAEVVASWSASDGTVNTTSIYGGAMIGAPAHAGEITVTATTSDGTGTATLSVVEPGISVKCSGLTTDGTATCTAELVGADLLSFPYGSGSSAVGYIVAWSATGGTIDSPIGGSWMNNPPVRFQVTGGTATPSVAATMYFDCVAANGGMVGPACYQHVAATATLTTSAVQAVLAAGEGFVFAYNPQTRELEKFAFPGMNSVGTANLDFPAGAAPRMAIFDAGSKIALVAAVGNGSNLVFIDGSSMSQIGRAIALPANVAAIVADDTSGGVIVASTVREKTNFFRVFPNGTSVRLASTEAVAVGAIRISADGKALTAAVPRSIALK